MRGWNPWTRALQARDTIALLSRRRVRIDRASAVPMASDPVVRLARRLHPPVMSLRIAGVRQETPDTRTYRLVPDTRTGTDGLPCFRAGQYLVVQEVIEGVAVTRPYSIASPPDRATRQGFLELTIRARSGAFFASFVREHWRAGHVVKAKGPFGTFYYDPLRDTRSVVGLAGGAGISPLRAIALDLIAHHPEVRMILIHAVERYDEAIYRDELLEVSERSGGRLDYRLVTREPSGRAGVGTGLLSFPYLEEQLGRPADRTFFVCGPPAMYTYLEEALRPWALPRRRVRRESFGSPVDPGRLPGFPQVRPGSHAVTVYRGDETTEIVARTTEPLLVALERAGLAPQAVCRSGVCGACDALLLAGEVYVRPDGDGRRASHRAGGHIHLCATWPLSDIAIRIQRGTW